MGTLIKQVIIICELTLVATSIAELVLRRRRMNGNVRRLKENRFNLESCSAQKHVKLLNSAGVLTKSIYHFHLKLDPQF